MNRNVYLETYGCQMNVSDSQVLAGRFQLKGCNVVDRPEDADLILVNTCAVREHAEERVFSRLGRLKEFKSARKDLLLGVTGCMAQRLGAEIVQRARHVDLVVGTGAYGNVFDMIGRIETTGEPQVDLSFGERFDDIERPRLEPGSVKAFLSIMEGCNKSCSFCIVPHTRGRERYKPLGMILREAGELVSRGVREITLLGQNINSYRDESWRFADVLTEVGRVRDLPRVRFTTSHPINTDEKMLQAMAGSAAVCEQLHLPLQSGSDRILAAMRRGYTLEHYRRLAGRARELMRGLALTTDIIVGFPGETDEDFEMTYRAMEEIRFDSAYMFVYSPRRGTRAQAMDDHVPASVSDERLQRIIGLQREVTDAISRELIGRTTEVLVDAVDARRPGHVSGKTRNFKPARFPGDPSLVGTLVDVRVREAQGVTLFGEAVPCGS